MSTDPQKKTLGMRDATFQQVLAKRPTVKATDEMQTEYEACAKTPDSLVSIMTPVTAIMTGVTPDDFFRHHGAESFDFASLKAKFRTICKDYGNDLDMMVESYAVDFCSYVMYTIGPESRRDRRGNNKMWKLKFPVANDEVIKTGCVFVATYRELEYAENYTPGVKLCLTVKHAGLIAMEVFTQLTVLAFNQRKMLLLTPLAGAVFSKDDIQDIAGELKMHQVEVLIAINTSCQSGGQYLNQSSIDFALVAVISATKNMKDDKIRRSIIDKTTKQYLAQRKQYNAINFEILCRYASGGIPANLAAHKLIQSYELVQGLGPRAIAAAIGQTMQQSRFLQPIVPPQQATGTTHKAPKSPSSSKKN